MQPNDAGHFIVQPCAQTTFPIRCMIHCSSTERITRRIQVLHFFKTKTGSPSYLLTCALLHSHAMASTMRTALACLLLAPALVSATSFDYYRSVFCDAQSAQFFLERYTSPQSLPDDKACHQTPAGTMAMKLVDGLDSSCVGKSFC